MADLLLMTRRRLAKLLGLGLMAVPLSSAVAGDNDPDEPRSLGGVDNDPSDDQGTGDSGGASGDVDPDDFGDDDDDDKAPSLGDVDEDPLGDVTSQ